MNTSAEVQYFLGALDVATEELIGTTHISAFASVLAGADGRREGHIVCRERSGVDGCRSSQRRIVE